MTWYNIKRRTAHSSTSTLEGSMHGIPRDHQTAKDADAHYLQICKHVLRLKDVLL